MSSTELRDGLYCCKKTISSCTARYGCYELLLSSLLVKCKTLDARIQHLVDLNREAQVRMNTLEQGHMRNLEVRRPVVTPAASPKVRKFCIFLIYFFKGKITCKNRTTTTTPASCTKTKFFSSSSYLAKHAGGRFLFRIAFEKASANVVCFMR